MEYDYQQLMRDADRISKKYKSIELFSLGESVMEKKIFCLRAGHGKRKLFINGAHHGLEYLTAAFIMKFLAEYAEHTKNGDEFSGTMPLL